MACVRRLEVPPPETRNKCDAIFKSRVVAVRHSPHILGPAGASVRWRTYRSSSSDPVFASEPTASTPAPYAVRHMQTPTRASWCP